jgi:hypothetical protein
MEDFFKCFEVQRMERDNQVHVFLASKSTQFPLFQIIIYHYINLILGLTSA